MEIIAIVIILQSAYLKICECQKQYNVLHSFTLQSVVVTTTKNVHTAIEKERSIIWEVAVLVMVKKKIHMKMCLILNTY